MSEAQTRSLQLWLIGVLVAVSGTLFSLLWQNQQGIIQQLSDRINRIEMTCRAGYIAPPSEAIVGRAILALSSGDN